MKKEKINLNTEMDMVGAANAKELKDFYIKKIQTKMRDIKDSKEFIEKSKKEIQHILRVLNFFLLLYLFLLTIAYNVIHYLLLTQKRK